MFAIQLAANLYEFYKRNVTCNLSFMFYIEETNVAEIISITGIYQNTVL